MQDQPHVPPPPPIPPRKKVDLASLYPSAMTYDQQQQHHFAVVETKAAKKGAEVRFGSLYISIAMSVVLFFGLCVLTFIPVIIGHSATAGVPISLFFLLALYGLALVMFKSMASQAETVGVNATLLLVFYIVAFEPHMFAWHILNGSGVFNPGLTFGLTAYHFVVLLVLMTILFTKLLKQNVKLILMTTLTIISLFVAFIVSRNDPGPVPARAVQEQGF